jgi:cytochrome c peroxidase
VAAALFAAVAVDGQSLPNLFPFPNAAGAVATYQANGQPIDLTGLFFQSLGTNGRSCASCHTPAQSWSISAEEVKSRFEATQGLDPIFRTNDGSICDHGIDTSTVGGRRQAYKLLVDRGLIRVTIPAPANAEFNVVGVVNPYGCSDPANLALYRRPLPAANLRFLSAVMWDGRESAAQTGTQPIAFSTNPSDLMADLQHQALDATNGHAQGSTPLTPAQQKAIAEFETGMYTAQSLDKFAGPLDNDGAAGGPAALALHTVPNFFVGINDPLGGNPHGDLFTPVIFDLFDAWTSAKQHGGGPGGDEAKARIARGQVLFNSKPIHITGVGGLADMSGTCGTCHDSPNTGNHSVAAALDIGVADPGNSLGVTYLPTITLQHKSTGAIKVTTDPGRALITGLWQDVGKMKGPVLRGLAARAPYFHNGSAQTLGDVLDFYEKRFKICFSPQERKDLIAFLGAL